MIVENTICCACSLFSVLFGAAMNLAQSVNSLTRHRAAFGNTALFGQKPGTSKVEGCVTNEKKSTGATKVESKVGGTMSSQVDAKSRKSADPCFGEGRGGAWDHRRCGT